MRYSNTRYKQVVVTAERFRITFKVEAEHQTSWVFFPNGCKNVRPGEHLFRQRTIELLFKQIIVRKQRTGLACTGHCLGKRLSNLSWDEVPSAPLPQGTGLALAPLAEAPCAEGLWQVGWDAQEVRVRVLLCHLGSLGALQPISQFQVIKLGSLNPYSISQMTVGG